MKVVFADSFYFIALLNENDRHHVWAVESARDLNFRFITTHWILAEVADALCSPAVRPRVHRFVEGLAANPAVEVVADPLTWFHTGLSLFARRADKPWSLTDCISFAVMEARGIREALTGDHHFTQAGFVVLLSGPSDERTSF
jgi:hypothetical protein